MIYNLACYLTLNQSVEDRKYKAVASTLEPSGHDFRLIKKPLEIVKLTNSMQELPMMKTSGYQGAIHFSEMVNCVLNVYHDGFSFNFQ